MIIIGTVKIIKKEFNGWKDCVEVSNGLVDFIATTVVGPRIIRFGFTDSKNEFCEVKHQMGKIGGDEWNIFGGHRLWHSPEARPRSCFPDNFPINWSEIENGISLSQPMETTTGIKKDIDISLSQDKPMVTVIHKLTNMGMWPLEFAVWALSVMAPGGKAIIPQPSRETDLLANRSVALWPYAKMNDSRVYWGDKYITVNQDTQAKTPFKLGIPNEDGWAAYYNSGHLFVKKFTHFINEKYPDYGSSWETYTNHFMMEMESLSPLKVLEPGETASHKETWYLLDNVDCPKTEEDMDKIKEKVSRLL